MNTQPNVLSIKWSRFVKNSKETQCTEKVAKGPFLSLPEDGFKINPSISTKLIESFQNKHKAESVSINSESKHEAITAEWTKTHAKITVHNNSKFHGNSLQKSTKKMITLVAGLLRLSQNINQNSRLLQGSNITSIKIEVYIIVHKFQPGQTQSSELVRHYRSWIIDQ